jgi:hypothetical protein
MYYTGIDYHKRYSVACTLDAQGRKIREARIPASTQTRRQPSPPASRRFCLIISSVLRDRGF